MIKIILSIMVLLAVAYLIEEFVLPRLFRRRCDKR